MGKEALVLSVLDQAPIPEGLTAGDALKNTLDLAKFSEQLGYRRYWVAEHHGTPGLACNSPEVLIGPLAASTSRIRIGSGGIMLPHYSPLKVAENFGMLSNLYPGRIDLGIGRAAGTSRAVAHMLQRDRRQIVPDDFPEQLNELLNYFHDEPVEASPFKQLPALLERRSKPELWLLGSSEQSAIWAAELGLPYCFADFINPGGAPIARYYAHTFTGSNHSPTAQTAVAAWVICADTDEEAQELSLSARMMMTLLFRGKLVSVPTVERAKLFLAEERVPLEMLATGRRFITGSPARVKVSIESLARDYGAQEVFLVNILHNHAARRRSYELIAEAFGLSASQERESAVA
jgi:luciferase family oxidoreductase group 1